MNHLDLFTGYGGFTIAGKEFNFNTVAYAEIDKYANAVLQYRFPGIPNLGDVSKIDTSKLSNIDVITGGTPCQDLSVAGKGAGLDGKRSGLFFHFIRIIRDVQPRYFIWENVKGALSSNQGWDFARVQIEMVKAGYGVEWIVLNAKDYGVPQNRERIFAIGTRGGSRREVFHIAESSRQNPIQLNRPKHSGYRCYSKKGASPTVRTMQGGNLQPKILETGLYAVPMRWSRTEKGRKARRDAMKNGKDYTPFNKGHRELVESDEDVSGCITNALNKDSLLKHDMRIRRLTPTECERLMGLEDGWTSKGIMDGKEVDISDTQRYKMCGNGVVVDVVKIIYNYITNGNN